MTLLTIIMYTYMILFSNYLRNKTSKNNIAMKSNLKMNAFVTVYYVINRVSK